MRNFFKSKLIISLSLLFLFILLSIGLYLWSINGNIQTYSKHVSDINKLQLLDNKFDTFSIYKGSFVNYDIINAEIKNFDITLNNLQKRVIKNREDSKILQTLITIKSNYKKKRAMLEHFKSFNSTISSSLQYLYDLQKSINKQSSINKQDKQLISSTLFMTNQLYTGLIKNRDKIYKNIENLANRTKNNNINYFYRHQKYLINKIFEIEKKQKDVTNLDIKSKLNFVSSYIEQKYQRYLITSNLILLLFMFSMVVMVSYILHQYKKSLHDKVELQAYKYAIENSDNSIVITDKNHNITYVNEAFEKETGYKKEEVLGNNPRILKSGVMPQEHYKELNEKLKNHKKWEGEFINRHKNGNLIYEKASINPVIIDGKLTHFIAIKLNITDYIEQKKKVEFLALHDTLTSLPNRLHFEQYFNEQIVKMSKKATLFYIDLDRFKTINDSLGHHVGDALLQVFSQRLKYALDKNDFIARIGGDEFVIILNNDNYKNADKVANRILEILHSPIHVHNNSLNITTSIGLSFYPDDGDDLETLMKHADSAMYSAKNNGRDNFKIYTQELSNEIDELLDIEQTLRNAKIESEFYLVYQPKYSLKTEKIIGFEALIRWESPKLGFVGPDKFIPIAEEIGIIDEIGLFVFQKACEDFKTFLEIDSTLKSMAINISTIQFKNENFIQTINELCNNAGIRYSQIELEITERCIMSDVQKMILILQELKEYGYKIAIDDFGTGYSSFGYLKKLPINTIKIDKSFVDDITSKKTDRDIVYAIINLCKNLGFQTVAEGIENKEQEKLLLKDGCVLGQGYHFCKPQKIEDMKKFIKSKTEQKIAVEV